MSARSLRIPVAALLGLALTVLPWITAPALATDACGFNVKCSTVTVTAGTGGTGAGTVTSTAARTPPNKTLGHIDCRIVKGVTSGTCTMTWEWPLAATSFSIDFTFTPDTGSYVCDFPQPCQPEGQDAKLSIQWSTAGQSSTVETGFLLADRSLAVSGTGTGSGTVLLTIASVVNVCTFPAPGCPSAKYTVPYGTAMKLVAAPDAGASFTGWTGACSGQGATCHLTMDSAYPTVDRTTNVVFGLAGATPPPTTSPTGAPTSKPSRGPTLPPATAAPGSTAGQTAPVPSEAPSAAAPSGVAIGTEPPATFVPVVAPGSNDGIPVGLVIVIALLAALVAGLAVALVFALRRTRT